ncbi:Protein CBG11279 [Caenorhabditis briggsae]|uniref:Protein CBG11279 n=1 Tax=Caenorhabditis briggsae TaxID=6238 RepID=A8XDE1_CAEBR|nr:Protein CBG11279 [Caenorhabditis briggsae]CAP30660.2 Protein CBG11279 [Caenorhabditis briggsae]
MRTQSVSKEMICIALCGVLSGVIRVIKSVFEVHEHFGTCHHSYRYYVVGLIYFLAYQIINQFILWLIIYITFLRAMVILEVKRGLSPPGSKMLKIFMISFICLMTAIFFFNHLLRVSYHRIEEIVDEEKIEELIKEKRCKYQKVYNIEAFSGDCLRRILLSIAGVTGFIIPIFIMIVLTIFLVIELRSPGPVKSAENTKKQINATYGLVAFLFCYIFAELPYVFLFALGLINPSDFVQLDEYIYSQVDAFICSSMCIGIIIYAMMSAQYRDTICATFCRSHKISPGPSVFLRD